MGYNKDVFGEVASRPRRVRLGRKLAKMYYVYILYSETLDKKYIGSTDDLKKRLKEHNSGCSKFTKSGIPWMLLYYEAFISKYDALIEEKFLKSGKGRDRLKYLLVKSLLTIKAGEVA